MKTNTNRKNDGRAFERELEKIAIAYHSRDIMRYRKVDPPHLIFKKFNRKSQMMEPTIIFQPNPWLDYVGSWTERGGRMLTFESKSTSEDRLPAFGSSGFSENQWRNLRSWTAAGAVAFLLWRCPLGTFLFDFYTLMALEKSGRKSIKAMDGSRVSPGFGLVTCDFANNLRSIVDMHLSP